MRQSKLFRDKIITMLQFGLAISMLGCAVGNNDESSGEPADRMGSLAGAEQTSALATSGTWFTGGDEFCRDFFPNSGCFPPSTPLCDSTVIEGQSCSPVGAECFKLITSGRFRIFDCF